MLAYNNCFSWLPSPVFYNEFRDAPSPRTLLTLQILRTLVWTLRYIKAPEYRNSGPITSVILNAQPTAEQRNVQLIGGWEFRWLQVQWCSAMHLPIGHQQKKGQWLETLKAEVMLPGE